MSNVVPEPYWYEDIKHLYEDGPAKIDDPEHLEELGYITQCDSGCEYILTPEGESALIEYQDRSLEQAKFNVTKIIGFLTGFSALVAVLLSELSSFGIITLTFAFIAVVLIISAISIQYAFWRAF